MPKTFEDLKTTIFSEAKNIVLTEGIEQLNMRKVATNCGVAVGTLYNYYPTKEGLLSELMYNYWLEFIGGVQNIIQEDQNFHEKLKQIYLLLEQFTETFLDTWVNMNKKSRYTEKNSDKKREIVLYLIQLIEEMLINYLKENEKHLEEPLNTNELASFIVQNFLSMGQMKQFKYETFDSIIKKIV